MIKQKLLFRGPIKTLSGYGSHSRDLLKSLYDMDSFDIYIDSCNWGKTPMTALEPEVNLFHTWIEENIVSSLDFIHMKSKQLTMFSSIQV